MIEAILLIMVLCVIVILLLAVRRVTIDQNTIGTGILAEVETLIESKSTKNSGKK